MPLPLDSTFVTFGTYLRRVASFDPKKSRTVYDQLRTFSGFRLGLSNSMVPIHNTAGGVCFAVKLHPRAKRSAITGEIGDALKLSLTAPPVDGRANQACIEFFANLLEVPRSSVTIASGETSRNKVIRIAGLSAGDVKMRLAI
jgi:uncharacterized protein (TIGR00251 family)